MDLTQLQKGRFFYPVLFSLLSLTLYFQCIGFGYVLDDTIVLDQNQFVAKGFAGIWDILSTESFTGYFGEQQQLVAGARYRPLSIVTFAIEQGIFGKLPWLSHLINILLYGICCWLVFLLVKLLQIKRESSEIPWMALLAGIFFLAHPIHTEAVANIKGRDEIMCMLFSLLSVIGLVRQPDGPSTRDQYQSGAWFFLALLSKENAITFLAVMPLVFVFFRNMSLGTSIRSCLWLFIPAVLFLIIRSSVIGFFFDNGQKITDLMNNPFVGMNAGQKFSTILLTLAWYIKLLFVPHPLTHDYYPYHVPKMNPTDIMTLISLILLVTVTIAGYRQRKNNKPVWFAVLYFWFTISIVSNLIFPVGTFMNERFLFMPSFGFVLVLVYILHHYLFGLSSLKRRIALIFSTLLLLFYVGRTMTRVPDWKDSMTLNLAGVNVSKNSARINLFTGVSYFQLYQKDSDLETKRKNLDQALRYIDRALFIFPNYGQALNMKAGILAEYHKMDKDLSLFLENIREIILKKPDLAFIQEYFRYIMKDPNNKHALATFCREIGYDIFYKQKLRYDMGILYMSMAKELRPFNQEYSNELAEIYEAWSRRSSVSTQQKAEFIEKANQLRDPLSEIHLNK
ncbi:MAG: hypothetical protein IPM48_05280 [Saprospiraceae bacterium]|nr:hypothetical protein [Saprospiraceae bacterium]